MNVRPLEVALALAQQLKELPDAEQRQILLILADLVKERETPAEAPEERPTKPSRATPAGNLLVSYKEAAERTGISIGALYQAVGDGRLKKYGDAGKGRPGKVSLLEIERAGMKARAKKAKEVSP